MNSSVQYTALARLLTHNNRVHDLEEMLNRMPVIIGGPLPDPQAEELQINPFADMQDEMDREVRTSLVHCWLAMPEAYEE